MSWSLIVVYCFQDDMSLEICLFALFVFCPWYRSQREINGCCTAFCQIVLMYPACAPSTLHCCYRQCGILYASVLPFQTPQLCFDYWPDWVQSGLFSVILLMICSFCQLEAAALGTYILKYVVARAWCGTPTLLPERTWHDLGVACQGSQITNALYRASAWIWRLGCAYRLCNLQYDSTCILQLQWQPCNFFLQGCIQQSSSARDQAVYPGI